MKTTILAGVIASCFLSAPLLGQVDQRPGYSDFPIILTLQFHSLSLPFKDISLSNFGFGLGTEVSFNGKQNWVQQVSAVWYHNKAVGNGLLFYTQMAWRPTIGSDGYAEVKAGAGYLYSFRPVNSYKQLNGTWVSAGHQGKGMFTLPMGIGVGYNTNTSNPYFSPFVNYQFLIVSGYNKSIPIVPETLLQVGTRVH